MILEDMYRRRKKSIIFKLPQIPLEVVLFFNCIYQLVLCIIGF